MSSQRTRQTPSRDAIVRAVASSTAIETGQRIAVIEAKLRSTQATSPLLSLALNRPARRAPR
jgi:hypothetical protein